MQNARSGSETRWSVKTEVIETAYAKINLALHVRRRREDGYHELETLFAFVDAGDVLSAAPAGAAVVLQVPLFPLASDAIGSASLEEFADGFVLTKTAIEFFDAAYQADRSDPRGFPILGDHSNAPATICVTASLDPIRDSGRDYAKALVDAGRSFTFIEVEGVTHSFTNLRGAVPSTQADLVQIVAAMKTELGER